MCPYAALDPRRGCSNTAHLYPLSSSLPSLPFPLPGRLPLSMLHLPSRSSDGMRGGSCAATANLGQSDEAAALEHALHRPYTISCEVPNGPLTQIRGTAGGCSCLSYSRDGRWLAAAFGNAEGAFKVSGVERGGVRIYQAVQQMI